ncbi:hypothetical protein VNI00_003743 [Paramarasmius palmivorus]|uniref:Uncharacterized protein n=1 Tax=Paramarasmius palmivorus TaxID=297713 RepID=A0AAW0DT14_9AGAR
MGNSYSIYFACLGEGQFVQFDLTLNVDINPHITSTGLAGMTDNQETTASVEDPHHRCWKVIEDLEGRVDYWVSKAAATSKRLGLSQEDYAVLKEEKYGLIRELKAKEEKIETLTGELNELKREMASIGGRLVDAARFGPKKRRRITKRKLNFEPKTPVKQHPHSNWNLSSPKSGPLSFTKTPPGIIIEDEDPFM